MIGILEIKSRVSSYGRDGEPGGEGDDADLDSLRFRHEPSTSE